MFAQDDCFHACHSESTRGEAQILNAPALAQATNGHLLSMQHERSTSPARGIPAIDRDCGARRDDDRAGRMGDGHRGVSVHRAAARSRDEVAPATIGYQMSLIYGAARHLIAADELRGDALGRMRAPAGRASCCPRSACCSRSARPCRRSRHVDPARRCDDADDARGRASSVSLQPAEEPQLHLLAQADRRAARLDDRWHLRRRGITLAFGWRWAIAARAGRGRSPAWSRSSVCAAAGTTIAGPTHGARESDRRARRNVALSGAALAVDRVAVRSRSCNCAWRRFS